MIFFCNNSGAIFTVVPEKIYQGSVNANTIYFVGAFDQDSVVTARFALPNGLYATEEIMSSAYNALTGDIQTENGVKYGVWALPLRSIVTELSGVVGVQFTVTNANANGAAATVCTALSSFPVEKGVPVLQDDSIDNYETLLTQIKAVLAAIKNGETENYIASAENAAAAQQSAVEALAYMEAASTSAENAAASAEAAKVNAGTKVTVDGVFQETWNADTVATKNYVDSRTTDRFTQATLNANKLVGIQPYVDGAYPVYIGGAAGGQFSKHSIACYYDIGQGAADVPSQENTVKKMALYTGTPVRDLQAANKKYVDDKTSLYKTTIRIDDNGEVYTIYANTHKPINESDITLLDIATILSESGEDYSGINSFLFEHIATENKLLFIVLIYDNVEDDNTFYFGLKVGNVMQLLSISAESTCTCSSIKV